MDLGLPFGEVAPVDVIPARALEQWIVDVGHVLNIFHAHPGRLDKPDEHVEHREGEGVAHVT